MLPELIERVREYNPGANFVLIEKAFLFSENAHKGQKRKSGEDYFIHPYEVALILTELKADTASICAAFLHDILEDCDVKLKDLEKEFGEEIANLVEGVTKLSSINFETREDYKSGNVRKVLLATTKDIRVILIKLADRLHNMRTLSHLSEKRQSIMAMESANIYAPVAQKLGLYWVKGELEDLSLRYLDPEAYKFLASKVNEKRREREKKAKAFIVEIEEVLKEEGINAKVIGRAKYFSSIYKKMKRLNREFNQIYDLTAFRVITDTVDNCYRILGQIHEKWKPVPGRFKDYIAVPKANGYQSLHTHIINREGRVLEIQIRTKEMDVVSEEGVAAHWRYKGTERDKKFEQKLAWIKNLLHWKMNAREFVETLKFDFFEKEIIVFTPKGDPIVLPEGGTVIDFAYLVHTGVGNKCSKVEVNGKIVPFDYVLNSGDIVNVITNNKAVPNRQWLKFVKTSKARNKIRAFLGIASDYDGESGVREKNVLELIEVESKRPLKVAGCCSPSLGVSIIGFLTKDGKITVHAESCVNVKHLELKKIDVAWKEINEFKEVRVFSLDRAGLLSDILDVISKFNVNILKVGTRSSKNRTVITFRFDKNNKGVVDQIVNNLKTIKDVTDVEVDE